MGLKELRGIAKPRAGDARARQEGGDHYRALPIQPWDVIEANMTPAEVRGYHKATVLAYVMREAHKNRDEDLRKARHHLERLCELIEQGKA